MRFLQPRFWNKAPDWSGNATTIVKNVVAVVKMDAGSITTVVMDAETQEGFWKQRTRENKGELSEKMLC